MTHPRIVGIAIAAALAVAAFLGASSASAVVLCEEKVGTEGSGECPSAKTLPSGTRFHASLLGTESVFVNSGVTVKCATSTVLGETSEESNMSSLDGLVESLTFTSCMNGAQACSVTAAGLNYLLLLLLNGEAKWHVITEEKANKEPRVEILCAGVQNCTFGTVAVLLGLEFRQNEIAIEVSQQLEKKTAFCPETTKWTAFYSVKCLRPVGTLVSCYPAVKKV